MEKYIQIRDLSKARCYENVNCRILYLHVACRCDVSTYTYAASTRQLARETGLSHRAVRTAAAQLVAEGYLTTHNATRQVAHSLTHMTTQDVTHLHVVTIRELDRQADRQADTQADTGVDTQKNNINNTSHPSPFRTHDARAMLEELSCEAGKILGLPQGEAKAKATDWLQRCELKRKEWSDKGDALAHLLSWIEKHTPIRKAAPRTDAQARAEEKARTREEILATPEVDRLKDELQKLSRWYRDADKRRDTVMMASLDTRMAELRQQIKQLDEHGQDQ